MSEIIQLMHPEEYFKMRNKQYAKITDTNFCNMVYIADKSVQDRFINSQVWYQAGHPIANMFYKEQMAYEQGLTSIQELKAVKYAFLGIYQQFYN